MTFPRLAKILVYDFSFYSNEPPYVNIQCPEGKMKVWLETLEVPMS